MEVCLLHSISCIQPRLSLTTVGCSSPVHGVTLVATERCKSFQGFTCRGLHIYFFVHTAVENTVVEKLFCPMLRNAVGENTIFVFDKAAMVIRGQS